MYNTQGVVGFLTAKGAFLVCPKYWGFYVRFPPIRGNYRIVEAGLNLRPLNPESRQVSDHKAVKQPSQDRPMSHIPNRDSRATVPNV